MVSTNWMTAFLGITQIKIMYAELSQKDSEQACRNLGFGIGVYRRIAGNAAAKADGGLRGHGLAAVMSVVGAQSLACAAFYAEYGFVRHIGFTTVFAIIHFIPPAYLELCPLYAAIRKKF